MTDLGMVSSGRDAACELEDGPAATSHRGVHFVVLGIAMIGCTGEPRVLTPRAPPPRVHPPVTLRTEPLGPGQGRVVLHTTDGPMRVSVRADESFVPPGQAVPPTRSGELCITPCVSDLPAGRYKLFMVSADGSLPGGDVDVLDVREGGLNYHLRSPSQAEPRQWIPVLPVVMAVAGGLALAGGAALMTAPEPDRTAGALLLLGGGIAITAGGIVYYDASRGTQQEGATTHWWEPIP
jgi:hypothetical protein